MGIARDLQGRHADAQSAYRQALGVAPGLQAATVNLALSLALDGRAREGAALLRPLASGPDASDALRQTYEAMQAMADAPARAETR